MKKILIALIFLFSSASWGDALISPIGFQNTDENRKKVISFIVKNIKKTFSNLGMDDPSTLRMMEKLELTSFKELLEVKDVTLLRTVIIDVCDLDMCDYNTILTMYNHQKKASNSKLQW